MPKKSPKASLVPQQRIEQSIVSIRGHKVMLDSDLSVLYGVPAKYLNRTVARNLDRFPADFMFQLTPSEFQNLKFHFGTSRSLSGCLRSQFVTSKNFNTGKFWQVLPKLNLATCMQLSYPETPAHTSATTPPPKPCTEENQSRRSALDGSPRHSRQAPDRTRC
jgi:ORF6N domain-containing protein